MILFRKICLEELSRKGRAFNWESQACEKCKRQMWGHGFVCRYFSEVFSALYLKRFRCPSCGVVATTRPDGYWRATRSSILSIYAALSGRLRTGSWASNRQRAGHWLRRFVAMVRMNYGDHSDLVAVLDSCLAKGLRFFP